MPAHVQKASVASKKAPPAPPPVPEKRGPERPPKAPDPAQAAPIAPPKAPIVPQASPMTKPPVPSVAYMTAADGQKFAEQIEALKAQIAKLAETAKARKTSGPSFEKTAIIEGLDLEGAYADDWRAPYHGQTIILHAFNFSGKKGAEELTVNTDQRIPCLLAIPRDAEAAGAEARNVGHLAVHHAPTEDGSTYLGEPFYLTEAELAAVWPAED